MELFKITLAKHEVDITHFKSKALPPRDTVTILLDPKEGCEAALLHSPVCSSTHLSVLRNAHQLLS